MGKRILANMIVFGPPALFAVAICAWVVLNGSFPSIPIISGEVHERGILSILFNWGTFILFWAFLAGFLFILGVIVWFRTYAALEESLERRSLKKINKR
jgi:hypothetical protein